MFPYLAMLAVPSSLALTGARRGGFLLLLVALLYWLMIGFRFQVGMDWNNYIFIYEMFKGRSLAEVVVNHEPGYGALTWFAAKLGWGIIFVNAVSALVFCWGFFAVARRCNEPLLAIVVATPLLVVAFAMSSVRQPIAAGIIFYLFATWEQRSTLGRFGFVVLAMLFHFSAIFVLIFVALASGAQPLVKTTLTVVATVLVVGIVKFAPGSMEAYSRLYVGTQSKLSAPGAIVQVGVVAAPGAAYLFNRRRWDEAMGETALVRYLAWGSLGLLPLILISSVGAYRFALYFWPMGMYVYSNFPQLIPSGIGRAFYRTILVIASFAMLIGWLQLGNSSLPWWPYRNWLFEKHDVPLITYKPYKR